MFDVVERRNINSHKQWLRITNQIIYILVHPREIQVKKAKEEEVRTARVTILTSESANEVSSLPSFPVPIFPAFGNPVCAHITESLSFSV